MLVKRSFCCSIHVPYWAVQYCKAKVAYCCACPIQLSPGTQTRACKWLSYCFICCFPAIICPRPWHSANRQTPGMCVQYSAVTRKAHACLRVFVLLHNMQQSNQLHVLCHVAIRQAAGMGVPHLAIATTTHTRACDWLFHCIIYSFKAAIMQPLDHAFALLPSDRRARCSALSYHKEHTHAIPSGCFTALYAALKLQYSNHLLVTCRRQTSVQGVRSLFSYRQEILTFLQVVVLLLDMQF